MKILRIVFTFLILLFCSGQTFAQEAAKVEILADEGEELVRVDVVVSGLNEAFLGLAFNLHFNNEILDYQSYSLGEEITAASPLELIHLDRNRLITGIAIKGDGSLPVISNLKAVSFFFKRRAAGELNFYFTKKSLATLKDNKREDLSASWLDFQGPKGGDYLKFPFGKPLWLGEFITFLFYSLFLLVALIFFIFVYRGYCLKQSTS